ncbi:MAG: hypothetical protein RJR35_14105 [Thermoanaerobacterales bacterium]|nr:hypothetical protein [Thermoanaerobacterales bacterium]
MSCTCQCNKQQENDIKKDASSWQFLQELLEQYRGKKGTCPFYREYRNIRLPSAAGVDYLASQ